ncbi:MULTISPECIES: hypothetical protein [unclassified Microcoleus]|uniref:hypothetical protein n=1 Tax=unclassified Microcoleus TaxID=2642155 RepID=UPI002FD5292C
MSLVTVKPTGKKVVTLISRPRPDQSQFDLSVNENLVWRGGVYVCVDGRKEYPFSCELPLSVNGDRIQVGSLYSTVCGVVTVKSIVRSVTVSQYFEYIVETEEGTEEKLLSWEFDSAV